MAASVNHRVLREQVRVHLNIDWDPARVKGWNVEEYSHLFRDISKKKNGKWLSAIHLHSSCHHQSLVFYVNDIIENYIRYKHLGIKDWPFVTKRKEHFFFQGGALVHRLLSWINQRRHSSNLSIVVDSQCAQVTQEVDGRMSLFIVSQWVVLLTGSQSNRRTSIRCQRNVFAGDDADSAWQADIRHGGVVVFRKRTTFAAELHGQDVSIKLGA